MSHLGNIFAVKRKQAGLRPVDLARKLGKININKACRHIMNLEMTGQGRKELIDEIAAFLNITEDEMNKAIRADWFDWLQERLRPCRPYIVTRYMAAVYGHKDIPDEIKEDLDVLAFACKHAVKNSRRCCLVLNGLIRIYLSAEGTFETFTCAKPDNDFIPSMRVGKQNFLIGSPDDRHPRKSILKPVNK